MYEQIRSIPSFLRITIILFQIAGLIAIALVYNPNCKAQSYQSKLNCQPLTGTKYAVWVSYLSVISSGMVLSMIIWIGIVLNRAFREFIILIVVFDFVWLIPIGVLSGYCAYYENALAIENTSSYQNSYYNSIIYNIGAFGAAAASGFVLVILYLFDIGLIIVAAVKTVNEKN